MRVGTRGGSLLLSVSTNVFPAEGAEEVFRILADELPAVRDALSRHTPQTRQIVGAQKDGGHADHPAVEPAPSAAPGGADLPADQPPEPFGVELRVGSRFLNDLRRDPGLLDTARGILARERLFLFSLNAFPLAPFQAPVVKDRAYDPPWGTPARLEDTKDASRFLAALLPEGIIGTVSTSPGTYRPWGGDDGVRRGIAEGYLAMARFLAEIEDGTGRRILLCIEPEPSCLFATVGDWIRFFAQDILSLASTTEEEGWARRYLGLTPDAAHLAVEFEDPARAFQTACDAGIPIPKVHLSAAAEIDPAILHHWRHPSEGMPSGAPSPDDAEAVRALLCEPRFLHQTTARLPDGSVHRWDDVPEFLRALPSLPSDPACARVHFHLPLQGWDMRGLRPTTEVTCDLIEAAASLPEPPQFVTETYTWPVLREGGGEDAEPLSVRIAGELAWARNQLQLAYSRQMP